MSLSAKRRADAALSAEAPPAVTGGASAFTAGAYGRCVWLNALAGRYTCVLVEALEALDAAVAALEALCRPGYPPVYVADGEFDTTTTPGGAHGKLVQRMALLSVMAVGGDTVFAFHLPSLLRRFAHPTGRWWVEEGDPSVARFFAWLRTAKIVTWAGEPSDLPALAHALPRLGALAGHWDLQANLRSRVRAGALPHDTPLGLGRAAVAELGVSLDKSWQLARWGQTPSAQMLGYAAGDVVVTEHLYRRHERGVLFGGAAAEAAGGDGAGRTEGGVVGGGHPSPAPDAGQLVADHAAAIEGVLRGMGAEGTPRSWQALANAVVSNTPALNRAACTLPGLRSQLVEAVGAWLRARDALPEWAAALA